MTGDFDQFAAYMREKLSGKREEYRVQKERQRAALHAEYERIIQVIRAEVIPVLEDAKGAFERQGFRVEIAQNWSESDIKTEPRVSFQVFDHEGEAGASASEICGAKSEFFVSNGLLRSRVPEVMHTSRSKPFSEGEGLAGIQHAVRRSLQSLVERLAPGPRLPDR